MSSKGDELFRDPGTTGLEHVMVRELTFADLDAMTRVDSRSTGYSRRAYLQRKLEEAGAAGTIRISLAAETEGTFAGFLLGRLWYGEFGEPEPVAILDTLGVDPDLRGRSVGKALLLQLETNLRGLGITKLRTEADWQQFDLLGFLAHEGYRPVPRLCLEKNL